MRSLPLTDRPADAVLFRTPSRDVGAAAFVAEATALAATLPDRRHVANLCQDRYGFALGFAAALLRGQVSLLGGELFGGLLSRLAAEHEGLYALVDSGATLDPPLPVHRVGTAAGGASVVPPPVIAGDQVAAVVLTSGSTGAPVGTAKRWAELVARSRAAGTRFDLSEGAPDCVLGTVPPGHMYGLETTVLLPLHAAASSWCGPGFFPADIAAVLDRLPAPHLLVTTPLHLRAVLDGAVLARPPRRVISATAPLDPGLAARAGADWGARVVEIFGATEVGSIASRRTVEGEEWSLYDGLALDFAASDGRPWVWGLDMPARPLADRIEPAGPRGFRLLGRGADVVKLAGRRASLAGLTRILIDTDGVEDGVFLLPEETAGTGATARLAAVVVAPGHSMASLTEALRGRLDPVFLPRPLVLVQHLPRNPLGKLPRADLLALLAQPARRGLVPVGGFTVPEDHPSLPGHFPGDPLVPGVVLLDHTLELAAGDATVAGVTAKFLAPVRAGEAVEVAAGRAADRVDFTASRAGEAVLKGTARLA